MQLRDAGKLDLEDTLDKHVEGAAHTPTLRRLLSHTSGLQRETHDDAWLNARFAPPAELLETLDRAEQVLPAGARFHYSNLAFALLGIVVERVAGMPYTEYVRERLLRAARARRAMTFEPRAAAATGYLVAAVRRRRLGRGAVETGAWIAAGQMWGTVGDLCRWAAFLAEPDEAVLAKETVEEMRTVQTIADHVRWLAGYGLGLQLLRDGERILAGHGGSMPGFIARARTFSPTEKVGAAALTNSSEARLGAARRSRSSRTTVDGGRSRPSRGASTSRRPTTSCRCSASGSWRRRRSSSAGGRQARGAVPGRPDWEPPRCSSGRRTTAGASSPGGSTARRCASSAATDGHGAALWPATRSRASQDHGRRPSSAYSYCSASSTFSRDARRAGKIAASSPAMIAASDEDEQRVQGSAKTTPSVERAVDQRGEHDADGDPEHGADERRDRLPRAGSCGAPAAASSRPRAACRSRACARTPSARACSRSRRG